MANWGEVLNEIATEQVRGQQAFDTVRRKYLSLMQEHTGRNVITYYSGWQQKPGVLGTEIRDEDRDGFMRAIHQVDTSKGLDLIIHTPGGSIAATQSIVTYLKDSKKFGQNIRAFVPHSSAVMASVLCQSWPVVLRAFAMRLI